MHKNVRGAFAAREESESAETVEPLHLRPFESAGWRHSNVRARGRHLRRMQRGRLVHGENAKRLQTARTVRRLDDNARTFIGNLEPVAAQTRHVQKNVRQAIVRNDESVALGYIKPFNNAGQLDDARRIISDVTDRLPVWPNPCGWPL